MTTNVSSFAPTFARNIVVGLGTVVLAGVCLFGATAPAVAATAAPRTVTIAYSDLNLASNAGRKALDARIVRSARSVCAENGRDLAARTFEKDCVTTAVASARAKLYAVTASAN